MKKLFSIAVISFLVAVCTVSCGNSANTSENSQVLSESSQAESGESKEPEISIDYMPATEALPELSADTAAETDFVGKWECSKLVSTVGTETGYADVPISKMIQFEVNDDKTAKVSSFMVSPDDEAGRLTWEYSDNTLILTDTDGNPYDNCIIQDGELVMFDDEDFMQMYFKKVDEFTPMTKEEEDKIYAQMESEGYVLDDSDTEEETETKE
ncbi:MAG: hypothetical protein IJM19_07965 [Ruminococcus sp.]|nr:hypothetical protein [Ruminococcus sp.]